MNINQINVIIVIVLKVLVEIFYFCIKNILHNISIDKVNKENLENILYTADNIIIIGETSAYNIFLNKVVVQNKELQKLDEYLILLHEFGHYKDISNRTKDFRDFIIFLKSLILFMVIIIFLLVIVKYNLNINIKFLQFSLIIELMLLIVDFIISFKLEIDANIYAFSKLNQQLDLNKKRYNFFYYMAMISQLLDRLFFIFIVFFLLIVYL